MRFEECDYCVNNDNDTSQCDYCEDADRFEPYEDEDSLKSTEQPINFYPRLKEAA